jgi:hypothetical protein
MDFANAQNSTATETKWQQEALTSLIVKGHEITLDEVHQMMVTVIGAYRDQIRNRDQHPDEGDNVKPQASREGWSQMALKEQAADGNQWRHNWWVILGKPERPTDGSWTQTGESFYVRAADGYVLSSATNVSQQDETYEKMYAKYTNEDDTRLVNSLIALMANPAAKLEDENRPERRQAARQIAAALYLAEVHRNYLTLLVNLAMLDLVKAGVFKLNKFLVQGFHPMAQGGPMRDVDNGTAGALQGGKADTRTRALEATIIMHWLQLLEPSIELHRGKEVYKPKVSGATLSGIRKTIPNFDRELVGSRDMVMLALKNRIQIGLLAKNALDYYR